MLRDSNVSVVKARRFVAQHLLSVLEKIKKKLKILISKFVLQALEILTDPIARGTYDKLLKAREHAAIRHRELDAKRRKLKEDLEARERSATERRYSEAELEKQLQREVARLREEGSRIIAEESRKLREDLARSVATAHEKALEESLRVKIRWNRKLGSYSEEELERFLKRHGRISSLIVSSKKPGNAMVEFVEAKAAQSAVKYVKGLPGNPLTLSLVNQHAGLVTQECGVSSSPTSQQTFSFPPAASRSVQEDSDFEKMVLAKMRARGKEQKAEDALAREVQSVE